MDITKSNFKPLRAGDLKQPEKGKYYYDVTSEIKGVTYFKRIDHVEPYDDTTVKLVYADLSTNRVPNEYTIYSVRSI